MSHTSFAEVRAVCYVIPATPFFVGKFDDISGGVAVFTFINFFIE